MVQAASVGSDASTRQSDPRSACHGLSPLSLHTFCSSSLGSLPDPGAAGKSTLGSSTS